jgi:hypothetical protein
VRGPSVHSLDLLSHACACLVRSKIRETLNNLILNSPQEWQTGVALPFVRIQGTTVEWDVRANL